MNLPNAISLARLFSAPLVVWLILSDQTKVAFWVFLIAAVSDGVDGFIAKRRGMETVLGGFLDPIADKVLLVGAYAALGSNGILALWLVILVIFRDLLIVGGGVIGVCTAYALQQRGVRTTLVERAEICAGGLQALLYEAMHGH